MSAADLDDARDARPAQPRSLIVTIYGSYARDVGGWLSVATLIRLMAALGVDEPAVRSSISRLKRRGVLAAERLDGAAGYALSDEGRAILSEGDRRIFGRRTAHADDGWVLAVFSVPESQRAHRHTLRSRLAWLGFGTVAPGVWIAPGHLADEARDVLTRLRLADYVDLFEARYLGFAELPEEIGRWWNLDQLQESYAAYLDAWRPALQRWRAAGDVDPEQAFTDYVCTLTDWRRLPYMDPGLPVELLPDDWKGTEAAELFFELRERLAGPARDYLDQVRD
ncbi:PaaX family transcriptional regulator [Phytoactinopolyspora sp. XMNu-373]|uniref:PaaX family transcriptional regulator n=1 Tax=Phytoactinopolyspora mesophila TaxID=2650750 RepID=A0A7K3M8Q2_9ACTN|nr:PaaX family transcriptional regulator C-terminal domain-containing protein [Phytoactinopolyspora mesophila]NDL59357.1 PaaX family transcriptional regulator [Phytoactinopolyspora mesophila]